MKYLRFTIFGTGSQIELEKVGFFLCLLRLHIRCKRSRQPPSLVQGQAHNCTLMISSSTINIRFRFKFIAFAFAFVFPPLAFRICNGTGKTGRTIFSRLPHLLSHPCATLARQRQMLSAAIICADS